ncbi:unnamed protein product [Calypogeia fissa]
MAGKEVGRKAVYDSKSHHEQDYASMESGQGKEREPLLSKRGGSDSGDSYTWSAILLPFLFPALGGLLFGYDIGATSGATVSLADPELSGTSWYDLSPLENGLVVSGSLYGALPGSIVAFNVADSLGRRRQLLVASFIYALGGVASAFTPNLTLLIIGRLVYGVGIGLAMHAAPLYISETTATEIRGLMVSLKEVLNVCGILLGYFVGSLTINAVGGWRIMYGVAIPIAVVMGLGIWWLPPSPRWLLLQAVQGNLAVEEAKRRARATLLRVRGGDKVDQSKIDEEVEATLSSLQETGGQEKVSFAELFRGKVNQRALAIGGGLVLLQQITGQPSVLYYAATILQSAGFPAASDATVVSVFLGFWKLLLTLVATFYVDKLGRRPLLITGVSGILLSLLALAAYYSFALGVPFLAIAALLVYVGSYQLSFGPISWLMVSEVFPLRTRGRAVSLTTLINFGANAVVALAYSPIQEAIGASFTFLIFAVIAVVALVFVIFSVPETKGLSLEEIENKLSQ